jgi:GNAT superfamily N-acetyltransferase
VVLAEEGARMFWDTFAPHNTVENMTAYIAAAFNPAKQAQELADRASKFLIAELDDRLAGYARLKFGPAPSPVAGHRPVEIVRIYARQDLLGTGIGARLMGASLEEATRAGCDVVWLGVWERNPRAIGFYRKWGFREVGDHAFMLGDDLQRDLVMARSL